MRTYLATLHKRPPAHKKRFALLTSGIFTLLIFSIWALATFGSTSLTTSGTEASANAAASQANPFGSLFRGLGASFQSLVGDLGELKEGLEVVNFEAQQNSGNGNTLNNYGE